MKLLLTELQQFIHEPILGRGLRYFEDGAVRDFSNLGSGDYEATVYGSEEDAV